MNYLQLVQEAMYRAGVREAVPTTLTGAVSAAADFKRWVNDSWRELQEESVNWFFRQKLDQTLAITASDDDYSLPSDLETMNFRTVTIYETAKTDESKLVWTPYEEWRTSRDTVSSAEGRPTTITERPDGVFQIWPVPDKAYTLRFDGVWAIDEMSSDSDTPGSTITAGTRLLPALYEWVLVWGAVTRFAEHHEDPEGLAKAQSKYLAQHARLNEKQRPPIYVKPGILTGTGRVNTRGWWRS